MTRCKLMCVHALVLTLLSVSLPCVASAFEFNELQEKALHEKAEAMHREAAALAEEGHLKQATEIRYKVAMMLEEAKRAQGHRPEHRAAEMRELRQLLEKLHRERQELVDQDSHEDRVVELNHEITRVEKQLRELVNHPPQSHPDVNRTRRLDHMRHAVEHLHQAELHELAEQVVNRIQVTEREMQDQQRHRDSDPLPEIMRQLDELRREVMQLKKEMIELK